MHILFGHCTFVRIHVVVQEGLGVGLIGQSARHLERCMQVVIDKAGRDDRALAIHHVGRPPFALDVDGLPNGGELAPFDGNRCVPDDTATGVDRNQPVNAADDQVCVIDNRHYLLSPT